MSEFGENPESSPRVSPIKKAIRGGKFIFDVNMRGDYDKYIDPQAYDERQRKRGREELGADVAETLARYVPIGSVDDKPKVLDLAAGTGIISEALQKQGYEVTATDLSIEELKLLSANNPDIKTIQADMNSPLSVPDDSFDGVTIVWGNRYIKDSNSFLSEVRRILKPGGVFLWPIFPAEVALWKGRNGIGQHTNTGSLARDAESTGFKVEEKIPFHSKYRQNRNLPLVQTPSYLVLRK